MKTHDLAKLLLEMPDVPVTGYAVGQGCSEGEDEDLYSVELGRDWKMNEIAILHFG